MDFELALYLVLLFLAIYGWANDRASIKPGKYWESDTDDDGA